MRAAAGICGGILFAALAALFFELVSAYLGNPNDLGWLVFLVSYVAGLLVALRAPTARKAWERLLAMSGLLSCALGSAIFVYAQIRQSVGHPPGPFMGGMGLAEEFAMIALIAFGLTLGAGAIFLRRARA